jgi:putative peptide zinc metalloprotease protein
LLQVDVTPDSAELLERYQKKRKARWKQWFGNPMSQRIPLFDPDRVLNALHKAFPWAFALTGAVLWLLWVVPAVVLAARHWTELTQNVADQVLTAQNLALMAVLFVPIKAWHEFCHEMDVMFLVFAPVPYVDSSAASAFQSKYRRAIVGAAGMIGELVLAALAMYVWLLVEPGIVRAIAYNVMLVAGISTLVVNGNPLLRYDGYYILADLIEIPNLAQRGKTYCTYLCDKYLLRARDLDAPDETRSERLWLAPYTVLSWFYRCFVTIAIILFVAKEFFIFGALIALWAGMSLIVLPLWRAAKHVKTSPSLHQRRPLALRIAVGSVLVVFVIGALVPLPIRTRAQGVVWLHEDALVRAQTDGFVVGWLSTPGTAVTKGSALVVMSDDRLAAEQIVDRASVVESQARYDLEAFANPAKAAIVLEELQQQQRKLANTEFRYQGLIVKALTSGVLTVSDYHDMEGRRYRKGDLLGYLIDPANVVARAVVSQDDIDLVRTRLTGVRIRTRDRVESVLPTTLVREFPSAVSELPSAALTSAGGGQLTADPADENGQKIYDRVFMVDLKLPDEAMSGRVGSRVEVRFSHQPEPLFAQAYRRLRQLFLSRLNV